MNKQTAVEWLVQQYDKKIGKSITIVMQDAIQQAKTMEKEQIIDAYDAGLFDGTMDEVKDRIHNNYYNETYKGGENE